jgi:hypothetical protein
MKRFTLILALLVAAFAVQAIMPESAPAQTPATALINITPTSSGSTWVSSQRMWTKAVDAFNCDSIQLLVYFPDSVRIDNIVLQKSLFSNFQTPIDSTSLVDSLVGTGAVGAQRFKVYSDIMGKGKPLGGYIRFAIDFAATVNHTTTANKLKKCFIYAKVFGATQPVVVH